LAFSLIKEGTAITRGIVRVEVIRGKVIGGEVARIAIKEGIAKEGKRRLL
jgi:hypothetical protein